MEQTINRFAKVVSLQCVYIQSPDTKQPFIIDSRSIRQDDGIQIKSQGGIHFQIEKDWKCNAQNINFFSNSYIENIEKRRIMNSESLEILTSNMTFISKKIRIQSTNDPFELQSLHHTRNAFIVRCPKGGITLASGTAGIHCSTSGNINFQLETENSALYLGTHGTKSQFIHIGSENSSTIIHSDLTINGKLRLSDSSIIEKHITSTVETTNILNLKCDRSDIPYDYGIISNRHNGIQSGLVFDHISDTFYFAKQLGVYKNTSFSPPLEYGNLRVNILESQTKIVGSSIETHHLKCKLLKHTSKIVINTPIAHFTNEIHTRTLTCTESIQSDKLHVNYAISDNVSSKQITTHSLNVNKNLMLGNHAELHAWFSNTIGPHGNFETLQDGLDSEHNISVFCMQSHSKYIPHNCTCMVNQEICVINGNNSILTGVIEVTHACTQLIIQDAICQNLTIHSSDEYKKEYDVDTTITLQNITGTLKDCGLNLAKGTLNIHHSNITFKNPILGILNTINVVYSHISGTPWYKINDVHLIKIPKKI